MGLTESEESADTLPPGTQLGRYEIAGLMGRGGMGAVYEATHRDLKKRVAVKTLHPAVAALPGARARFLREGEAASRIQHPNVVDVTDVGTEGNISYLVMEFLEGQDLAQLIARSGPLPIAGAVDIMLPVLGAITAAHEEGVIHRDLKPENVFMATTRHGDVRPTVLDFGISKISSSNGGNTLGLTGTGASMGTPYYIAPEQIRSAAGVDARSDQYALGAILYECVTGRRAHQGETIYEVIRSVGEGSFAPPRSYRPDIPPALEDAILRAMQLDPSRRFSSVPAFGRAIMPFASSAARNQWARALAGEPGSQAESMSPPPLQSQPGGTVVLQTPAPGSSGTRLLDARQPRSAPPANTTFGSSAAQIASPVRRRSGLLAGLFVALAGCAIGAYFLTATTTRHPRVVDRLPSLPPTPDVPSPTSVSPPPEKYRVDVTANPRNAEFHLDGALVGTGRVSQTIAVDGVEHTLTVTAPGFQPATVRFRDHAPAEEVTLAALPPPPVKTAFHVSHPTRQSEHSHEGNRASAPARPAPAPPVAAPPRAAPPRAANNAAILDD